LHNAAAVIEAKYYGRKTRLAEIIEFAKHLGCERIGLAFCIGLAEEARAIEAASAMNRYTKWEVLPGNRWTHPTPVCFDALPPNGWIKKDRFDWNRGLMEGIG